MKIYSVNECSRLISTRLQKDYVFHNLAVKGTVSSMHRHFSGTTYFTLLDGDSRIFCVIGRMRNQFLTRGLESGMEATVIGNLRFNTVSGWPVLFAERIMGVKKSTYQEAREKIYEGLSEAGYFDPFRKKSLPLYPFHIGIVTSESGAVVHDILRTGRMRNPSVRYTLYGTDVQGKEAAAHMAAMIEKASRSADAPDVLILARGGGGEDDLSPFNEKVLLHAIHECRIPLISAVGHETDTTLADLAADRRASTPTQAAEIAIPSCRDLGRQIQFCLMMLDRSKEEALKEREKEVKDSLNFMKDRVPQEKLEAIGQAVVSELSFIKGKAEEFMKEKYKETAENMHLLLSFASEKGEE